MTVSSGVIEPFLEWNADAVDVPLLNGLRIQILPTFEDLYHAKRHQYAAFIASEALLIVWDDEPTHLLQRAKNIEAELLKFVWRVANNDTLSNEKEVNVSEYEVDEETGLMAEKERPIMLYNCFLVACSLCLLTILIGLGYVKIADEVFELHKWISLSFLIMTPVNAFLTLVSSENLGIIIKMLIILVLLFSHCQRRRPNHWTDPALDQELKILFCNTSTPHQIKCPSSYHDPMSSL